MRRNPYIVDAFTRGRFDDPGTPRLARVGGTAVVAFRGEVELEP